MNTFIFFDSQPFSERNFNRFNIKTIKAKNFKVEYWNCSKIINKKIENKAYKFKKGVKVINFESFSDLLKYSLNIKYKNSFYVDYVGGVKFSIIKRILQIKKIKRLIIREKWPLLSLSLGNSKNIFSKLKILVILIITKLYLFLENLIANDIYLASNFEKEIFIKPKKLIKNHNLDYNLYLKNKNKKKKNNYIVFLDQGHPLPWDRKLRKGKPILDQKNYWNKINKFLLLLQKKYKKKVVICEHPRNKLGRSDTKFRVVRNNTFKTISESRIVVSHFSLALQQAILLKKEIILLKLNIYPIEMKKKIEFLKDELNIPIADISNEIKYLPKIKFNKKNYSSFSRKYIFEKSHYKDNSWEYLMSKI